MGSKFLIDTNIWVDLLGNVAQAATTLKGVDDAAISAITYMEVASGCTPPEKVFFDLLLENGVEIIDTNAQIRVFATAFNPDPITLRGRGTKRLADSIISATAVACNRILITRNPNDFNNCTGITIYTRYQGKWTVCVANGVEVKIWTPTFPPATSAASPPP